MLTVAFITKLTGFKSFGANLVSNILTIIISLIGRFLISNLEEALENLKLKKIDKQQSIYH